MYTISTLTHAAEMMLPAP